MRDVRHSSTTKANNVLLVFCAPARRDLYLNALPPLGILSIAAHLESKGIRTDVVDGQIDDLSRVDPCAYDVIGFSINVANVATSLAFMARIRREHPRVTIVAGGPHVKSSPEFFMAQGFIDAVCPDEGEEALREYFEGRKGVAGMHVRTAGGWACPGPRPFIEDLDALPFPALDKVDVARYDYYPKRRRPISSIMTSRGCPYGCIFCSQAHGRRWRARSAENVVAEIEWQVRALGVREIAVYDDNFSLDRGRVMAICGLLAARRVPVLLQFTNGLRAENLDAGVVSALRRAGTWLVGVAPDTGTQRVMDLIDKRADLAQITRAVRACTAAGIRTFAFFMIGFPGETDTEIDQTIAYAMDLDADMVQFARVLAYKGTPLFEMAGARDHDHGKEMGYFYESGENRALTGKVRRAYRAFYLRPTKLAGLLRMHSLRDIAALARYSIVTKSI